MLTEKATFEFAVQFVLREEGGYSNDPNDPGGETNFGISKRYHPNLDIKALTVNDATDIYRTEYWLKYQCNNIPAPLSVILLDSLVNPGTDAAIRCLQEAFKLLPADGVMGPNTLRMAQRAVLSDVDRFTIKRIRYYMSRPGFAMYGDGWLARAVRCHRSACALAVTA